jgi:hypothetical protein
MCILASTSNRYDTAMDIAAIIASSVQLQNAGEPYGKFFSSFVEVLFRGWCSFTENLVDNLGISQHAHATCQDFNNQDRRFQRS